MIEKYDQNKNEGINQKLLQFIFNKLYFKY